MIKIKLDKKKRYLLACSYGPDSMALFDLLIKGNYSFAVAHVNYGLRDEAIEETRNLVEYCDQNKVKIYAHFVQEKVEKNIEEKCREIRYSFFKKIMDIDGYDALLVAHNQDDSFETYFLQKKRKNIVEYYGLNSSYDMNGYYVIRPLLDYSKEELQKYDDKNHVPYAIDKSNLEDKFERNKIRHNIVQKLTSEERIKLNREILEANIELLSRHNKILREYPILISDLLNYSDEDLAFFFTIIGRKYINDLELSLRQIKEFRKIMVSEKPNVIVRIKNDVYFVKSYNIAEIKLLPSDTHFYYEIKQPCKFDCEFFSLDFTGDTSNRHVKLKDYPLIIRNASKEDQVLIKDYYVSMRRQFINWKMPKELRDRWPIILNNKNEIVYVPKYDANFKPKIDTNFFVKI